MCIFLKLLLCVKVLVDHIFPRADVAKSSSVVDFGHLPKARVESCYATVRGDVSQTLGSRRWTSVELYRFESIKIFRVKIYLNCNFVDSS